MNPLNRLLNFRKDAPVTDDDAPTEEELKAQRIKFHREEVRNGPVKWKFATGGQQRRAAVRAETSRVRKLNRRNRRAWLNGQADKAVLRGQLQAVGALPYEHGGSAAPHAHRAALVALISRFGERDEDGELLIHDDTAKNAIGAALNTFVDAA